MNALTVSVDYDDLLAITLPRNARHFDKVLVVSTPEDAATAAVVAAVPNARLFTTRAFYHDGAPFAKGLAVEQGLDALGRDGWLCIFDADTLLPEAPDWTPLARGRLHVPRRRILSHVEKWTPDLNWAACPVVDDREHAGYCQVFHADDPVLRNRRPWYGVRWRTAAGCDSDFMHLWPPERRAWLPWHVLHIGFHGLNWCGRWTPRIDGQPPRDADAHAEAQGRLRDDRKSHGYRKEQF